MLTRVRDKIRDFKPQGHISFSEWQAIEDKAIAAKKFMKDDNAVYIWLKNILQENLTDIEENRLREAHTMEFSTLFITPKKVQDDEAIGQIKLIRRLFKDMEFWIAEKARYEKDEADGRIVIEHNEK